MNNVSLALEGAWRVLLAGLVLGAGLPALFALGLRSLAQAHGLQGAGRQAPDALPGPTAGTTAAPALVLEVLAAACFLLVLAAVGLGLAYIVAGGFGYTLKVEHLVPTFVPKG